MNGANPVLADKLSCVAELETQYAAVLGETAREVARVECFDDEQRAEVYAILEALRADAQQHCSTVGCWISHRTGEVSNV